MLCSLIKLWGAYSIANSIFGKMFVSDKNEPVAITLSYQNRDVTIVNNKEWTHCFTDHKNVVQLSEDVFKYDHRHHNHYIIGDVNVVDENTKNLKNNNTKKNVPLWVRRENVIHARKQEHKQAHKQQEHHKQAHKQQVHKQAPHKQAYVHNETRLGTQNSTKARRVEIKNNNTNVNQSLHLRHLHKNHQMEKLRKLIKVWLKKIDLATKKLNSLKH